MFYPAIRKVLFQFDAETIHELTIKGLKSTGKSPLKNPVVVSRVNEAMPRSAVSPKALPGSDSAVESW